MNRPDQESFQMSSVEVSLGAHKLVAGLNRRIDRLSCGNDDPFGNVDEYRSQAYGGEIISWERNRTEENFRMTITCENGEEIQAQVVVDAKLSEGSVVSGGINYFDRDKDIEHSDSWGAFMGLSDLTAKAAAVYRRETRPSYK